MIPLHGAITLLELILEKFKEQRAAYDHLMSHPELLEKELAKGEAKATAYANNKLKQLRRALGYYTKKLDCTQ